MATPVTHFEIHGEDPARLVEFSRGLFGWRIEQLPGIACWQVRSSEVPGDDFGGGLEQPPT
jgi:hypothetical protein